MGDFFWDLDNGDVGYAYDGFGVNSKGEEIMYLGGDMVENMATGEVHFVDHWPGETDEFDADPFDSDPFDPDSSDDF